MLTVIALLLSLLFPAHGVSPSDVTGGGPGTTVTASDVTGGGPGTLAPSDVTGGGPGTH